MQVGGLAKMEPSLYFFLVCLDLELDETEVEEEEQHAPGEKPAEGPKPKPELEMSEQINLLLATLDFNQIDSYR